MRKIQALIEYLENKNKNLNDLTPVLDNKEDVSDSLCDLQYLYETIEYISTEKALIKEEIERTIGKDTLRALELIDMTKKKANDKINEYYNAIEVKMIYK